jgi:hypothetical protein
MSYITVDIIFRKPHIKKFVEQLSVHHYRGVVEFSKGDRLNSVIRQYLVKPPANYKPMWDKAVTKILVPLNGRERYYMSHSHLQKKDWKALESDFEDIFFKLYYDIEMIGTFVKGTRKDLRIKFLEAYGITDDIMSEDTFRKAFDRFLQKKSAKAVELMQLKQIDPIKLYKSVV